MNNSLIQKVETKQLREQLQLQKNVQFVKQGEFRKLLVSFRRLERSDVPKARICGLRDIASGIRYLIPEEQLFAIDARVAALPASFSTTG